VGLLFHASALRSHCRRSSRARWGMGECVECVRGGVGPAGPHAPAPPPCATLRRAPRERSHTEAVGARREAQAPEAPAAWGALETHKNSALRIALSHARGLPC
jgi:hypothetical protein